MSHLPELFDRRVKARSLAYVFTAGALLGVGTLAFPHDEMVQEGKLVALAGAAILISVFFVLRADRTEDWQLHAALGVGTLILTLANHYVGSTALYPIIYSWVVLYAFYFFPLPVALGHVAFVAVAYGVLLAIDDPPSPVVRWLLAVGTPTVAGLLISRLLGRLGDEVDRTNARELALRESESRTRLILNSAPDAFVATDGDGKVIRWNESAEDMFGWAAAEAIGRPVRDLLFTGEGRAEHDERRRKLIGHPDPVRVLSVETELVRRDGTTFPVDETLSRVRLGDDVVVSAFIRDASERQRRQQERETLLREQAARAEAERVAEMVSGMQLLVDATLQHQTLRDILPDLVNRARGVLDAEVAAIFLYDEESERLELGASSAGVGSGAELPSVAIGEGYAGGVAESRRAALFQDPPGERLHPALRDAGLVSLIAAPLLAGNRLTGVIEVGTVERRLTEEDLGLLRLTADRVALAIDHVRLYEREHRIAETLQRSLLPERLPQLPGLAVAARYRPAAAEAEVGGDWYDVIPIPGGRVGLVMGDVAGKGLAAASMVGRLRSALRAYALEGHDPGIVVERLNRLVWTELDESEMATLIYLTIDPAEGTIRWVNSGHLPPLLVVGGDRLPHFLEGGRSVPLGVLPFPNFEESTVGIEPGGTVVLYTDGLVERVGAHIDDGLTLLADVVRDAPDSPDMLCDHLLQALVPEEGTADDVALLALQNTPIADRFVVELPTEPEALASMRGLLRRWLRHAEGSDQEIAEITTACGEAATNAIEHAGASGDTPFEVDGRLDGREVAVTVRDFGVWRPPRDGDQGRGLSLMRALMDSVEVTPSPEGTTVHLRRVLNGDGREDVP